MKEFLHQTRILLTCLCRSGFPLSLGLKPLCLHLCWGPTGLPENWSLYCHTSTAAGSIWSWIPPMRCRVVTGSDCKVNMEWIFTISKEITFPHNTRKHLLFSRYPIIFPRDKCAGDLGDQPGVRSYGLRPADEKYDVYCYIEGLKGKSWQNSDITDFFCNLKWIQTRFLHSCNSNGKTNVTWLLSAAWPLYIYITYKNNSNQIKYNLYFQQETSTISFWCPSQVRFSMWLLLRVSPMMKLLLAARSRVPDWPLLESSMQPGKQALISVVLAGYWTIASDIQSISPVRSVEVGSQVCTLCMLTPTRQAFLLWIPNLMLTVSEVNDWQLSEGLNIWFTFSIINCGLILTVDLLLIANETGLNTTDIQEALLNITLITDLLRPGKIY